jgi:hypothetical protein
MISFDGADSGMKTQTFWFHSCLMSERLWNVCGTFVERLFFRYCFVDITTHFVLITQRHTGTYLRCFNSVPVQLGWGLRVRMRIVIRILIWAIVCTLTLKKGKDVPTDVVPSGGW